jgi:hypothetical protein
MRKARAFLFVTAALFLLASAPPLESATAEAQTSAAANASPASPSSIVDPAHCTVPVFMGASPGGDIAFTVVIRGMDNIPVAGSTISIATCSEFVACSTSPGPGITWNPETHQLRTTTDTYGQATFQIRGGGICGPPFQAKVYADGYYIGSGTWVSSDQNHDLVVDATDATSVESKIGTSDLTGDIVFSGAVTAADVKAVQYQIGTNCSARAYTIDLASNPIAGTLYAPANLSIRKTSLAGQNILAAAALAASFGFSAEAANIVAWLDAGKIFTKDIDAQGETNPYTKDITIDVDVVRPFDRVLDPANTDDFFLLLYLTYVLIHEKVHAHQTWGYMVGSTYYELFGVLGYKSHGRANPCEQDAYSKELAFLDAVITALKSEVHDAVYAGAGFDVLIPLNAKLKGALVWKISGINSYYDEHPHYGAMPYTLSDAAALKCVKDTVKSHLDNLEQGIPLDRSLVNLVDTQLDEFEARTTPVVEQWLAGAPARSTQAEATVDSVGSIGALAVTVGRSLECVVGDRLGGRRLASQLLWVRGSPGWLDGPVKVIMAYDPTFRGDVGGLDIWRYDETLGWGPLTAGRSVDMTAHTISATLDCYGVVGVCEGDSSLAGVADRVGGAARAFTVTPNPSRGAVQFSWVGWTGAECVSVYDVTGARRWRATARHGASALAWPGTDSAGRRLPAGVYYARLTGGGNSATVRFVLIE